MLSTALEQHKVTCIFKLFTLFPLICFLHLSPSHFKPVSLRSFPLDPGTFQLILYVQNFSHFIGKPALLYLSQPNLFWQDTDFGFSFLLDGNSFSFFHYSTHLVIQLFNIHFQSADWCQTLCWRLGVQWTSRDRETCKQMPKQWKPCSSGNPTHTEQGVVISKGGSELPSAWWSLRRVHRGLTSLGRTLPGRGNGI